MVVPVVPEVQEPDSAEDGRADSRGTEVLGSARTFHSRTCSIISPVVDALAAAQGALGSRW